MSITGGSQKRIAGSKRKTNGSELCSDPDPPARNNQYVGIKELTPAIVNEFIKKIIVHAPERVNGKRVQKVDIVFNFVGEINFLSDTQSKQSDA